MRPSPRLAAVLVLLPFLLSAAGPPAKSAIEVYFSPRGGRTDAIVREIGKATKRVRIQAYSFTSAPIGKALIEARKGGVAVEAILDRSNVTDRYSSACG